MAAFVDTNILIYAFADSLDSPPTKIRQARDLITYLTDRQELILSAQVLSEFAANAMRKGKSPLTPNHALAIVREMSKQTVVTTDESLIQLAIQRVEQSRISYWDALIVEAALRSEADILYTEDMHHGMRYGALELRNPFLS